MKTKICTGIIILYLAIIAPVYANSFIYLQDIYTKGCSYTLDLYLISEKENGYIMPWFKFEHNDLYGFPGYFQTPNLINKDILKFKNLKIFGKYNEELCGIIDIGGSSGNIASICFDLNLTSHLNSKAFVEILSDKGRKSSPWYAVGKNNLIPYKHWKTELRNKDCLIEMEACQDRYTCKCYIVITFKDLKPLLKTDLFEDSKMKI